jgi:hypothetical protein
LWHGARFYGLGASAHVLALPTRSDGQPLLCAARQARAHWMYPVPEANS